MKELKPLLNIQQLASELGISVSVIYSWVSQRKIPYLKIGRVVRFDPDEIQEWLRGRNVAERS